MRLRKLQVRGCEKKKERSILEKEKGNAPKERRLISSNVFLCRKRSKFYDDSATRYSSFNSSVKGIP